MASDPNRHDHSTSRTSTTRLDLNQENPQGLIQVAKGTEAELDTYSLVLAAVGIEHIVDAHGGKLLVAPRDADQALLHLTCYQEENLFWPPEPPPQLPVHPETPPTLLLMGALALFFFHTGPWSEGSVWFLQGAIDSSAILQQGEWWRLVTALTLHADLVHLVGNCLIGGAMIHFLGKMLGYGLAWLLLIVSGAFGNLLNLLLREQLHLSVGLSTAIFATIGIFTGVRLIQMHRRSFREFLLPLGAGIGLFAFLGGEGARTDIGAHFFGFISGLFCGVCIGCTPVAATTRTPWQQAVLLMAAISIVQICWALALN